MTPRNLCRTSADSFLRSVPDGTDQAWRSIRAVSFLAIAFIFSLSFPVSAAPPAQGYTSGVTEQFNLFFDKDAERIRERLDSYKEIGVELLRLHAFKGRGLNDSVYMKVLDDYDFRVKMILYSLPNQTFTDQNGAKSGRVVNFWHPDGRRLLMQNNREILDSLRKHPVWEKIDYVVPTMGPAGELTYPPTWTTRLPHMTFWCYGPYAQGDFRHRMRLKYETVDRANAAWRTSFKSWGDVRILKPGQHPGPYWQDILTWYRDSKRAFARWHVEEMKKLTDKEIILYIPGQHYTQEDWRQAVDTAGVRASSGIKMMLDSDFIIRLATETGCTLQYTGLSRAESMYIARRAAHHGYKGVLYGENAGSYGPASSPLGLGAIIVESGLTGIDYTSSEYLFNDDLRTPNYFHQELGDAFRLIKGETPPRRWTTTPGYIRNPDKAIWTIVSELGERHGLHAMYEGNNPPQTVTRENKTAWRIGSRGGEWDRLYFAVQHPEFGMGKTPRVAITVEYFDEGAGTVALEYDSSDQSVRKVSGRPGAFKTHPQTITLGDTGRWKTARFPIDDALFSNRCNVRDFRVSVSDEGSLILRSVGVEQLASEQDETNEGCSVSE